MLLKRIYDETDLSRYKMERVALMEAWQVKLKTVGVPDELVESFTKQIGDKLVNPPLIAELELLHTGVKAEQNFSTPMITEFMKLGIVNIAGDQLTLRTRSEDLQYTIKRMPGRWCLHCGEKLSDDQNGELARLHVAMKHKGKPSPIEAEPAGYQWLTYFECVLNKKQHNQYKKEAGKNG